MSMTDVMHHSIISLSNHQNIVDALFAIIFYSRLRGSKMSVIQKLIIYSLYFDINNIVSVLVVVMLLCSSVCVMCYRMMNL